MSQPSDIPGARDLVAQIKKIAQSGNPTPMELQMIIAYCDEADAKMRRAPRVTQARVASREMTPALAQEIKAYQRANPGKSQQKIGLAFNVSAGRVSEALSGQWDVGGKKYEAWVARNGGYGHG